MSRQANGSRKNHTLSREEHEIHDACFGASGSEDDNAEEPASPTPGQPHKVLQTGSIDELAKIMAKSLSDHLSSTNVIISTPVSRKRQIGSNEFDLPLPTGQPSGATNTSPIIFGADVNPPPPGVGDEDRNGQGSEDHSVEVLSSELSNVKVSDSSNADKAPKVAPDNKLPTCNLDIPNWNPDPAVLAWANLIIDSSEWSVEDRKCLNKTFIPEKEHEHLFEPVSMPQQIRDAMTNRSVVESDYLLKRFTAETFFYNCNVDIVTCYRPLLEVISNLTGNLDHEKDRFLLGRVFQGLVSATTKLSRGRRELARRFVPLINAPALFRTKPTHRSIFGKDSTASAVEQAVKDSKQDKALVYVPKKQKLPFRSYGSSGKGFQSFRYQYPQKFNPFNAYQQFQNYQNQGYENPKKGSYRGRGNRQRGRGGRGKSYQSRTPYSKTS